MQNNKIPRKTATDKIPELFLLRAETQRIYHEGKKYKNINNHMILELILLIKKSFYH